MANLVSSNYKLLMVSQLMRGMRTTPTIKLEETKQTTEYRWTQGNPAFFRTDSFEPL